MTRSSRRGFRGGWALVSEYSSFSCEAPGFPVPARTRLDGLRVTEDDARVILNSRPPSWTTQLAYRIDDDGLDGYLVLNGLELTAAEARAINDGAHPLAVLLPRARIRALTLAEMEGA